MANIPAIVANAYGLTSLAVIRLLGQHGVPVIGLFGRRRRGYHRYDFIRASRYLIQRRDFDLHNYDADFLQALLDLGQTAPGPYPLFVDSDQAMVTLSRHRNVLRQYFLFTMAPADMVEQLLDKRAFHELAAKHDLPVPRTFLPRSADDLSSIAATVRYPCIIKPAWRDERWSDRFGLTRKVIVAESAGALEREGATLGSLIDNCLIQEVLTGSERNILCSFVYLDERGETLAFAQCRKLRQYPLDFGNTSMAETLWDPEVEALTRTICATLRLTGYISIEFKRDPRDGQLKILEITPGRLNRQGAVTALSGVNLPYVWYRHLIGQPITQVGQAPPGKKWVSEVNEVRSVPRYLRDGHLRPWQIARSYRGLASLEIGSLRDPLPALLVAPAALRVGVQRLWTDTVRPWITSKRAG